MRRILVLQHVPYAPLGTLNPLLKSAGFRIRYANFSRQPDACVDPANYDGVVVLGGPMSANDTERYPYLETEIGILDAALSRAMPILGICLGAQLLARALGARVRRDGVKEIGWCDLSPSTAGKRDPLLSHLGPRERIFQWHGDQLDLPRGAAHLASSPDCANQAFRFGDNAYGFQFHLEVDERLIERWLTIPTHRHEIESLPRPLDPDAIRAETAKVLGRSRELAEKVFGGFVHLFQMPRRRRMLPSR